VTGLASASYHTPGAEIVGGTIRHGERIITIDDLLVSPVFVANVDELLNHYDIRSIYGDEIGQALAKQYDQNVARAAIAEAARGAAAVTGGSGGYTSNAAGYANDGTVLWQGIFNMGVALRSEGRSAGRPLGVHPADATRARGDVREANQPGPQPRRQRQHCFGDVFRINDIELVKTNNLPSANDSANLALPASRRHDYSVTEVLGMNRGAVGTVQLQDVTMEQRLRHPQAGHPHGRQISRRPRRLRPEAAGELRTGDPAS
jgi:hypothetical protein